MVRVVKAPDVRRSEILDVARGFFYQKGYEQTSIQDIIAEIGIAKGTFYHYFGSKLDLLDAIIAQMMAHILQQLQPLVADEQLSALEKFNQYFATAERWKVENKAFFLGIVRIWYSDDNAIFRDKTKAASLQGVLPELAKIIELGIAEGAFVASDPLEIAEIVMGISHNFSETIGRLLLQAADGEISLSLVEKKVAAAQYAIERVLNAPPGSINLFDMDRTRQWFG